MGKLSKIRAEVIAPFPHLNRLPVSKRHLSQINEQRSGSQRCYIAKNAYLDASLRERYGRDDLCLKVFRPGMVSLSRPSWEGSHIAEATKVQNLFAWEGLSPRVYDLVIVDGLIAQVTDYIAPEGEIDRDAFDHVMEKFDLGPERHRYKMPPHNWVGGKLVDFGGLRFSSPTRYKRALQERARYQKHDVSYQAALGDDGMRDFAHRAGVMRLHEVDFHGKRVLDVGCNLGIFTREALAAGAIRAVGVDKHQAQAAYEISNWIGAWNADFLELALPGQWGEIERRTGIDRFDVVFYFAVVGHVRGLHVTDCDLLIFEGHRHTREHYEPLLRERFPHVEFLGHTTDMGKRPVFWCKKAAT